MANENKLVKNSSKAYGYNYASLGDIVKQGFEIPKMRLATHEGIDYIEYFDGKEWQLGARIVVPEMKGSNEAQRYGSALTYARRYTAQMALQLVCDDDVKIETQALAQPPKRATTFDLKKADARIKQATSAEEVRKIYAEAPEKLRQYLKKGCETRVRELEQ
jgi:hypothetical protein